MIFNIETKKETNYFLNINNTELNLVLNIMTPNAQTIKRQ